MKLFKEREILEAYRFAEGGGQALHVFSGARCYPNAPVCFKWSNEAAHLFDQDESRLIKTAGELGVSKVRVHHEGTQKQHIVLCGAPLLRAKGQVKNDGE